MFGGVGRQFRGNISTDVQYGLFSFYLISMCSDLKQLFVAALNRPYLSR